MKRKASCLRILGAVAAGFVLLLVIAGAYLFWPVNPRPLASHPNPATSYAVAVNQIQTLQNQESQLNPVCKAQLLTHGQKTGRVVVLVHGYTNCPHQYRDLASRIFELGDNVLLVPLPHHGLTDRMNTEQGQLTAEELTAYADQVVDIAQGLGDRVTMIGISAGGVTTAWAAQHRRDIDRAIVISPTFGYHALPTDLTLPYMRAYLLLPNTFTWWNVEEEETGVPDYTYPRYSTRTLAQALRLGFAILVDAGHDPLEARSLVVVTNANDQSVNNVMTARAVAAWQKITPQKVVTYEFPAALELGHDIIDPSDPDANPAVVYPRLMEMIQAP